MKKIFTHILISAVLISPLLVYAADFGLQNPIGVTSISGLILIVTRVVRYIAIPFIVIAIMWSGFQYIAAGAKLSGYDISQANKSIKYTVIGAFILLSSELIALVMKNTVEGLTK